MFLVCAQAACCSRSLRLSLRGRCGALLSIALDRILPQAASWAAQGEQVSLRPLTTLVLLWWWAGVLALAWRSVTPVSTSRGNQPLVLGSPITGAARGTV